MGVPVFVARLVAPLTSTIDGDDYKYFSLCLLSENIFGIAQIVVMLTLCRWLGNLASRTLSRGPSLSVELTNPHKRLRLKLLGYGFLMIGLLAVVLLARSSNFGVANWLRSPRTGYQDYRRGNGQYWIGAQLCFSIATFVLIFLSRQRITLLGNIVLVMGAWWLLGSKAFLIGAGGFSAGFWCYKYGMSIPHFITATLAVFSLMIANWYHSSGLDPSNIAIKDVLAYFDMYTMGIAYYRDYIAGKIDLYHGKIFISSFWAYVPRAVYPQKPWVFGIVNVVEYFLPGSAEAGNTPAIAGAVEQFADFGYWGLVLAPFIDLAFLLKTTLSYVVCKAIRSKEWSGGKCFILSIFVLAPNWTQFTGGLYILILLVAIVILFRLFGLNKARNHLGKGPIGLRESCEQ
jgi:hypothetical protein